MELIDLYIEPSLDDKSGVIGTALVDSPATEEGFLAFNNTKKLIKHIIKCSSEKGHFTPIEGDKQILAGALMIPHKEIYRNDNGREYNVKFKPETISMIQEKFVSLNINNSINHMHDNTRPVDAVLLQHFIIDRKSGVLPPFGQEHLEDGTWYGYIKVRDKQVWTDFIRSGIYTGFSVEGYFYEMPVEQDIEMDKEAYDILDAIVNKNYDIV